MNRRGFMIIHNFRPGPTGGAELQAERLAIKLVELGHPIQILTRRTVPDAPLEENYKGVKIHRSSFPLAYQITTGVENTFKYLVKNRKSYDIIHSHMAFGHAVVAAVVARAFNKKCIIKVACLGEYGDLGIFSKFDRFNWALEILHQADAMVAISRDVEEDLLKWGFSQNRIYRIPNGVDTHFFRPNRSFRRQDPLCFLLMGRRHPQKGIDTALHAVRILKSKKLSHQFKIKFYGADYPEHDYEQMANQLDVSEYVEFYPFNHNVLDIYHNSHCLILPSRGEGLSNSLLESMATELPAIASRVSGTIDVICDGEDGILIPLESPEALADAMMAIINNPGIAINLGQNARKKMISCFSLVSVARQYSDLYNNL